MRLLAARSKISMAYITFRHQFCLYLFVCNCLFQLVLFEMVVLFN